MSHVICLSFLSFVDLDFLEVGLNKRGLITVADIEDIEELQLSCCSSLLASPPSRNGNDTLPSFLPPVSQHKGKATNCFETFTR